MLQDTDEPKSSDFMSGKTARIVFKNAIKSIPGTWSIFASPLLEWLCLLFILDYYGYFAEDIEFRLKFVDIYYLFDDSEDGIDEVYQRW